MLIKPESTTVKSPIATACGNCGVEDRLLIHHVRHRGVFRRLCATCVLRLNPQSFCPTCFQVYPPSPSNDPVFTCVKCYSSSHSHCVSKGPSAPPSPYICPLCINPNAPVFKLKTAKEANLKIGEGSTEESRVMARDDAKKLLAAAKIASASMDRAAVAAKAEAERRAKEAAITRKRAKEALEHVAYLVLKEKLRKKDVALIGSSEAVGSGPSSVCGNVGYPVIGHNIAKVKNGSSVNVLSSSNDNVIAGGCVGASVVEEKIPKNESEMKVVNNGNGIAGSCVGPSVVVEEKINAVGKVDGSNQVLDALRAVELRGNDKIGGTTPAGMAPEVKHIDNQETVGVDVEGRTLANAEKNVETSPTEGNPGSDSQEFHDGMGTCTQNLIVESAKQDDANKVILAQLEGDRMDTNENSSASREQQGGNNKSC